MMTQQRSVGVQQTQQSVCSYLQQWLHFIDSVALQLSKKDFPLPSLAPKLLEIGKEVNAGRGFKLVRYCLKLLCWAVVSQPLEVLY